MDPHQLGEEKETMPAQLLPVTFKTQLAKHDEDRVYKLLEAIHYGLKYQRTILQQPANLESWFSLYELRKVRAVGPRVEVDRANFVYTFENADAAVAFVEKMLSECGYEVTRRDNWTHAVYMDLKQMAADMGLMTSLVIAEHDWEVSVIHYRGEDEDYRYHKPRFLVVEDGLYTPQTKSTRARTMSEAILGPEEENEDMIKSPVKKSLNFAEVSSSEGDVDAPEPPPTHARHKCATNQSFAAKLGVPLVGCASHRFNLAVNKFLSESEDLVSQVQNLMTTLRQPNNAAELARHTPLRAVRANATRWSSVLEMLDRYVDIRDAIMHMTAVADLIPRGNTHRRIMALHDKLVGLNSVCKKLQFDGRTLAEVRMLFDARIEMYPIMGEHLAAGAKIVHSPLFEAAVVKVANDAPLTTAETKMLQQRPPTPNKPRRTTRRTLPLVSSVAPRKRVARNALQWCTPHSSPPSPNKQPV